MRITQKQIRNTQNIGFTLIEIIVTMAVLIVLITGTFVGFNKYNQVQKLNSSYDNLKTNLNEAKSNALSGLVYNCTSLQSLYGYKLNVDSASSYSLYEICVDASGVQTQNQLTNKVVTLPSGVTFNPAGVSVTFKAVTGASLADSSFTLTSGTTSRTVTVIGGIIK